MPIMDVNSEFAVKWQQVYSIQCKAGWQTQGLRILELYYIIEGNKRVSVLKYVDVYSYPAKVT